jgi:ATP-dependent RNA helicase DDX1
MSSFESLGLCPELITGVEEIGWHLPRDVQDEAIPFILGGSDVMIAAETGSGKTGALALPVIQLINESLRNHATVSMPEGKQIVKNGRPVFEINNQDADEPFVVSASGLVGQSRADGWHGARATVGVSSGKYYWEVRPTDEGLCRVGVSAAKASLALGSDPLSFGYGSTGKKSNNNVFSDFGPSFTVGDVIGIYLDADRGTLAFSKNGEHLGTPFQSLPLDTAWYPAFLLSNAEVEVNFAGPFTPAQLRQHSPLASAPLSATTAVAAGAAAAALAASNRKPASQRHAIALILEPTRELAQQVYDELAKFTKYIAEPPISLGLLTQITSAADAAKAVKAHIVVGTAQCVKNALESGSLYLEDNRFFILDEADDLFSGHSQIVVRAIAAALPRTPRPQRIICSATLHSLEARSLASALCRNPQLVDLKGMTVIPPNVDHVVLSIDSFRDRSWVPANWTASGAAAADAPIADAALFAGSFNGKRGPLVPAGSGMTFTGVPALHGKPLTKEWLQKHTDGIHGVLGTSAASSAEEVISFGVKSLKLAALSRVIDALAPAAAMIFCRSRVDCDNVAGFLRECGHSASVLNAGQEDREGVLASFKRGGVRFLVCTDLAARGIDVKELPLVVNFTLPDDPATYVHRIGRTGRAGAQGLAISLVAQHPEFVWFHTCHSKGRDGSCTNTTVGKKGCAAWMKETDLLGAVTEYLSDVDIPIISGQELARGKEHIKAIAATSRPDVAKAVLATKQHIAIVGPQAQTLYALELAAQRAYWAQTTSAARWAQALQEGATAGAAMGDA